MRIGLVSDTHVPTQLRALPQELLDGLRGADLILHAGDLVSLQVLEPLGKIAETLAVRGNMDALEVMRALSDSREMDLDGVKVALIHGHQQRPAQGRYPRAQSDYDAPTMEPVYEFLLHEFPDADVIVFGHFHIPIVKRWKDKLLINPGAVTGGKRSRSFAMLDVSADGVEPEIIRF